MVQVSVQPKGIGYLLKVGFPAVKKDGFGFDAISAEYPLTLGKAVDAAWIKAHAKPLEAEVTRSMRVDFEQIERFRDRLLDEDVMAKTLRSALGKGETDEMKRQAKAEALATAEFTRRWETFAKVTLKVGFKAAFEAVIKGEAAELRKSLAAAAEIKAGDYSKRPMISIAVSAIATIAGVVGASSGLGLGLALVGGLVSQAKAWVDHRKEIAAKLAITRDAEAGVRSGVEAAGKGLDQALKSLETLVSGLKLALGAGALVEMEKFAGQGAGLAKLDAPAAAKAKAMIDAAAKERAALARDLAEQAKRLQALKKALATAQTAVAEAAKLSEEGNKVWDGTLKQSEAMLKNIDDALKLLGTLK